MTDCIHNDGWNQCAVRVGPDHKFVHDFFRGQDDFFRGERRFLLLTDDSPKMGIAFFVRALNVDDRNIWI